MHRETAAIPADRLTAEREMLHRLPDEPHALVLGDERLVADDQTARFGSVRYSTPPSHAGTRVWCRDAGEELVITRPDRPRRNQTTHPDFLMAVDMASFKRNLQARRRSP